ncbi:hypothetical protein PG993_013190 [Apiospora rasikravindrae]|uniref:Uncharacterized protein n=1 Tax=Apiospora rasikravindrae TaxID=990691 RepID=A0ABR1RX20_9PEZI
MILPHRGPSFTGILKYRKENGQSVAFFGPPKGPVHNMITANVRDHAGARRVLAPAFSEATFKARTHSPPNDGWMIPQQR